MAKLAIVIRSRLFLRNNTKSSNLLFFSLAELQNIERSETFFFPARQADSHSLLSLTTWLSSLLPSSFLSSSRHFLSSLHLELFNPEPHHRAHHLPCHFFHPFYSGTSHTLSPPSLSPIITLTTQKPSFPFSFLLFPLSLHCPLTHY